MHDSGYVTTGGLVAVDSASMPTNGGRGGRQPNMAIGHNLLPPVALDRPPATFSVTDAIRVSMLPGVRAPAVCRMPPLH